MWAAVELRWTNETNQTPSGREPAARPAGRIRGTCLPQTTRSLYVQCYLSCRDNLNLIGETTRTRDSYPNLDLCTNFWDYVVTPLQWKGRYTNKVLKAGDPRIQDIAKIFFFITSYLNMPLAFLRLHCPMFLNLSPGQCGFVLDSRVPISCVRILGQNRLRELPDSFCDLISLEELRLSKNLVEVLPVHFGRLPILKDLRLDNNLVMSIWLYAHSSRR